MEFLLLSMKCWPGFALFIHFGLQYDGPKRKFKIIMGITDFYFQLPFCSVFVYNFVEIIGFMVPLTQEKGKISQPILFSFSCNKTNVNIRFFTWMLIP